jgi:hypothetical protein
MSFIPMSQHIHVNENEVTLEYIDRPASPEGCPAHTCATITLGTSTHSIHLFMPYGARIKLIEG